MPNVILKSLRVKNFGPFAEEATFSTLIDKSKKEHLENTFSLDNGDSYNYISYIFGANGSGKSNFCKALLQIQTYINLSPLFASNNPQLLELQPVKTSATEDRYFFFDLQGKSSPTEYSIEIILNGILYCYSFSVLNGAIQNEKLTRKKQRTETILNRTSSDYKSISLKSELSSFTTNISVVKDRALCLSMAAFLNNAFASELVDAIREIQIVNMASIKGLRNITRENFTEDVRQRCLRILKIAEPTMNDLHIEFTEEDIDKQKVPLPIDDLEGRELVIKNVRVDVQSTHTIYDRNTIVDTMLLPFLKYESNGTIKILSILPLIFHSLETGTPIVVDEIENGLHPNVVQAVLNMFLSPETNPLHAQLICTTHSILLAEKSVRRDQVWVISKDSCGRSTLRRISDYPGTRTTDNIAQKYLLCAFGDIPNFS